MWILIYLIKNVNFNVNIKFGLNLEKEQIG